MYRVYADADAYQRHCPYARAVPLGVHTMAVAREAAHENGHRFWTTVR